jgi:hypothetical protein
MKANLFLLPAEISTPPLFPTRSQTVVTLNDLSETGAGASAMESTFQTADKSKNGNNSNDNHRRGWNKQPRGERTMRQFTKYAVAAAVAAIVGFASQARAMTVSWGDSDSPFLTYNDGVTPLAIGVPVFLGKDSNGTVAGFTAYDSGFIGDGTSMEGTFAEAGNGDRGAGFFGAQIYLEVGSGNALITNPSWIFPSADDGSAIIDLENGGFTILVGSYSTGTITDPNLGAGSDALVTTIPVPEPSSIALVIVGLLGGAGLIRRRH